MDISINEILFLAWLITLPIGIYYMLNGNYIKYNVYGTLVKASIYVQNKNDKTYYRQEIFNYLNNGQNNTCYLVRPTSYSDKSDAYADIENTILGTERKLWISKLNDDKCIDESLKEYYTTVGCVLLSFFSFILMIIITMLLYDIIHKITEKYKKNTILPTTIVT